MKKAILIIIAVPVVAWVLLWIVAASMERFVASRPWPALTVRRTSSASGASWPASPASAGGGSIASSLFAVCAAT